MPVRETTCTLAQNIEHRSHSSTTRHHISTAMDPEPAPPPTTNPQSEALSVPEPATTSIPEPVSAALSVLELSPTLEFLHPLPVLSSLLDPLVLSTSPAPHNPTALLSSTPAPPTRPHSPGRPDPPWSLEGWPPSFDPTAVPRLFNPLLPRIHCGLSVILHGGPLSF
ncbi:hypothetical protein DPX16_10264 [Anabarilius grahami]|uniref:Uncharacterized protein n=1 Tax=Anabarilius grahami TaxID=495550 RepID=A0A3N0YDN4_ANAGA|nr:hypothetical protein DPX16_10264 [Anabarilius grahami]